MDWLWFLYVALGNASVYAVIAVGVVIVYRTNEVLPFHLGQVAVLGGYIVTSLWAPGAGAGPLLLAVAVALAVAVMLGLTMHVLVDRLGRRYGHFVGTVLTIAVSILMTGLISVIWQGQVRQLSLFDGVVEILGQRLSRSGLAVIAFGSVLVGAVLAVVYRSRLGINMQAVANDAGLARLRGVAVTRTLAAAWVVSSLLAVCAGLMIATFSGVAVENSVIGVSAIIAAILGGMHSLKGALLGALLLATGEVAVTAFFDPRYSQIVPVLMLVLLLTIRPSGLTGRVEQISRV